MTRMRILPDEPTIAASVAARIQTDYDEFAGSGLPAPLEPYLLDRYGLDLAAEYAGNPLKNPWGKASGQLSMTAHQVQEDIDAGLGFVVLKTVIAQDETGAQSMEAWAIRESRMVVEPILGTSGNKGWTVTWKGRGWWQSFNDYLQLIRDAQRIAVPRNTLIVPSCKYHLPAPGEFRWNVAEYEWTTPRLIEAWESSLREFRSSLPEAAMPLEMDFSPTLAGSDRAAVQETILSWLRQVTHLIRDSSRSRTLPRIGLKLFNALFDDEFQIEMLDAIHVPGDASPDFYIYGNRLFDPNREFEGNRGVAYGGPDLSDRNLRVMQQFHKRPMRTVPLPWSATGNIGSGRTALEYALCGASSFQLHTFFQLPQSEYRMRTGNRTERALHELYFHPQTGFVTWMHHLADALGLSRSPLRFQDLIGRVSDL
ncbi:MAG: hypothetical protein AB7O26_11320 [Planctomycetaceae bacterium]